MHNLCWIFGRSGIGAESEMDEPRSRVRNAEAIAFLSPRKLSSNNAWGTVFQHQNSRTSINGKENGNSHSTDSSVLIVNWNHSGIVSVKTLVILKNEGRNILIYGEEGSLEGGINHDVTAAAPFVKINTISLAHAYDNGTYACVRFDDEGCLNSIWTGRVRGLVRRWSHSIIIWHHLRINLYLLVL